jgi:hypothetical protein
MYNQENKFELKEIYVSDGQVTYVLRKSEGYTPILYEFPLTSVLDGAKNLMFSNLGFGEFRSYNDNDAKSLANYLQEKISSVNMKIPNAEKTLYDVLSSFGDKHA